MSVKNPGAYFPLKISANQDFEPMPTCDVLSMVSKQYSSGCFIE